MEKLHAPSSSHIFKKVLTFLQSDFMLMFYLLVLFFIFLYSSLFNFFVADDFTWIRWAHDSSPSMLAKNFIDAQGFFYRPIDKAIIYFEYQFFHLNPLPYKIVNLFFNFLVSVGVYLFLKIVFKKKSLAFLGVIIFSFLPSHTQDLFWFATISTTISTGFIIFGLYFFYLARIKKNLWAYLVAFLLMFLAVFSYENAVIFVLLALLVDSFLINKKYRKGILVMLAPYGVFIGIIALYFFLRINSGAAGFSGDYNYNLVKAIPNSIGNYLGYSIMYISGENLLYVYSFLRETLKAYWLLLTVIGFFALAFIGGFLIEHKEKVRFSHGMTIFIFGFLFSVFSLLPYLPLGNITLRYAYLASFGFSVMILCLIQKLFFSKRYIKHFSLVYTVLITCIIIGSYLYVQQAGKYWGFASSVTFDSFSQIKQIEGGMQNMYVYNVPIKKAEAYIFPVGFHDMVYLAGLKNTAVFTVNDLNFARERLNKDMKNNIKSKIFIYDNSFRLKQLL